MEKVVTETKNRRVLGPETLVISTKRTKCRKVNIAADEFSTEPVKQAEKPQLGRKAVKEVQFRVPAMMMEKDTVVKPVLFNKAPKAIETRGKKKAVAKNDDHHVKGETETKNRQVLEIGPETLIISTKRTRCRKVNIAAVAFPTEPVKQADKPQLGRKAGKNDEMTEEKQVINPSFTVKGDRLVCNNPACGRNYANLKFFGNHVSKWH